MEVDSHEGDSSSLLSTPHLEVSQSAAAPAVSVPPARSDIDVGRKRIVLEVVVGITVRCHRHCVQLVAMWSNLIFCFVHKMVYWMPLLFLAC
jgi:hypothetical protein